MAVEFSFVNILLVLFCAWTMGAIASRLGFPAILGELLAGIVFGPPILGILEPDAGVYVLSEVGVFLMMLYIGMEINIREMQRSGPLALFAAVTGFVIPLIAVAALLRATGFSASTALVAGCAAGVTSLAVGSRLLVDLGLMNTRLATILTTGALVSDTLALILFTALASVGGAIADLHWSTAWPLIGKILVFFTAAIAVGLIVLPRLGPALERLGITGRTAQFTIVLLVGLCYAEMAETAGLHALLGAFLAGLFFDERFVGLRQSHELSELVHDLSIGFLAPIFFVQSGFAVDLSVLGNIGLPLALIAVAFAAKLCGVLLAWVPNLSFWREGVVLGVGMNGRGALDLVIAGVALEAGLIDGTIFSSLVFLALASMTFVPVGLKVGVRWLRRHDQLVEASLRDKIVIVGGTPTALTLASTLAETRPVVVIDINAEHCAAATRAGLEAVCGNALDEDILQEANAGQAEHFIAITPNTQLNVYAAQHAATLFRVPHAWAYVDTGARSDTDSLLQDLQIELFTPGAFDLNDWDHWIEHDRTRVETWPVEQRATRDQFVDRLYVRRPVLPLVVERQGQRYFFQEFDTLEPGDVVHGVALRTQSEELPEDEFDALVQNATILDLNEQADAETCFSIIADHLAEQVSASRESILAGLRDRERADSTVLAPGLAVPHVIVAGRDQFGFVIVRSQSGIPMATSDDGSAASVHAFFATAASRDRRSLHLKALSAIAQIFQDNQIERGWLGARGPEELRVLLRKAKRRRTGETVF
ncbi:MAG: sodium:proton exchanger [Candidatus Dadabacteria bacterium]|nr:MAG: sodium:proton exchanger [Candidatus Dadabacteria bacterium]